MKRKSRMLLTIFLLLVFLTTPISNVRAQATDGTSPCPPFDPAHLNQKDFLHSLSDKCVKVYKELIHKDRIVPGADHVASAAIIGPDIFGYTYDDTVSYDWISATIESGLTGDDVVMSPTNIGFDFPFYGVPWSELYFSTNGLITFGDVSWDWETAGIPNQMKPNNFIAPFWDDLVVGDEYNTGAIYYSRGGSAPNRYFVLEWRNVETLRGSSPFSFEAILYENGNIKVQLQSLPSFCYCTVGIEDSIGYSGLEYQFSSYSAPKAILFSYPAPAAHVLVSPATEGKFAVANGTADFPLTVTNTGDLGSDRYELYPITSWPVTFYQSDGVTPLTDTDSDTYIDTGPITQKNSATIIAKFAAPEGAQIGDNNHVTVLVISSLDDNKSQSVELSMSVPAGFANILVDQTDGAMSFLTANSTATSRYKATSDNYYGYDIAMLRLQNGNYFYAWVAAYWNGNNWVSDIEYVILNRAGNLILPATKLTNNSSATMYTTDSNPSIAVTPDGTVGVIWSHYLYNDSTDLRNNNIYLATLNSSGSLLSGPVNVTNNGAWGGYQSVNVPAFFDPTIAGTDDNRFALAWRDERYTGSGYADNIWYSVRSTSGVNLFSPTALTNDGESRSSVLNSLKGGNVILTWATFDGNGPFYAVINSNGSIFKSKTTLGDGTYNWSADAVQLPNGKVAIAWAGWDAIQFSILNSSYAIESGPTTAYNPSYATGDLVSVTTDTYNRVIMSWVGDDRQFYALGDSTGAFITLPMIYWNNAYYISNNGQGIDSFTKFGDVSPYYWSASYIERLSAAGITGGCGGGNYCPTTTVTRDQMAIFLLRGKYGSGYVPPAAAGVFQDVSTDYWAASWIEQLAKEGITSGCSLSPKLYCPTTAVTRDQMAIFLLRAKYGSNYVPPKATGIFGDVPTDYWAADWIEQLARDGITGGCGNGNYCPTTPVTRDQMAVFLVRNFNLP